MTRVISVINYKGGVGKTTTVINTAAGLAREGARVLCIDLDPQGSLAVCLGVKSPYTSADLLLGHEVPERCIVSARPNLDVIVSNHDLQRAEGQLWRMPDERIARRVLYYTMRPIKTYDYVFLDCSHSISILTHNALLYAQELIIPVATDYLSMVGTRQVLDTLKEIGRIPDHRLRLTAVVPTMYYERRRKDREVMDLLNYYFKGKVTAPIRSNVRLPEATSRQKTIFEYDPRSYGAVDYAALVQWVKEAENQLGVAS